MAFRKLDTVTVRGKSLGSNIFEPICLKSELTPELTAKLKRHQEAIDVYYGSNRELAKQLFEALLKDYPDDKYYAAMLSKLMTHLQPSSK